MAPLDVIGVGMSRTGTKSLQIALNMLGYSTLHFRCFHQDESLDMDGFKDAIENREEADWDKLYENYNAAVDVIDFVPKGNILVLELGEGWERLCEFLDKPVPDVTYPNLNNPKALQESIIKRNEDFKSSVKSLDVGETK